MNAAARLLNQGMLSRGWVVSVILTRFQVVLCVYVLLILISALSLIYTTQIIRNLNSTTEQSISEQDRLHTQWDQLLLEKSTLLMQARVQVVAEESLSMIFPDGKSRVIID